MRVLKRADRSGPEPAAGESWPLASVEILDAKDHENVARSAVDRWIFDGVASLDRGQLVLHSKPKLTYEIVRWPGRYCCHCYAPLDNEAEAVAHLDEEHKGKKSPDPNNPSGWYVADYYECEKVS
jgi:hypothetical protein